MYHRTSPIVCLISITLFLSACGGGKGDPASEPNDRIVQASVMKGDPTIEMKIDSNSDQDWYGLELPDSGYVQFGSKNVPGKIEPMIGIALKQEWKDQKAKWLSNRRPIPSSYQVYGHDTIYFSIRDKHTNAHSSKSFKVKVKFIDEFDGYEANNSPDQARKEKTGKKLRSFIFPKGDRDWFKFQVDSAGYLMAQSRNSPDNIQPVVAFAKKKKTTGKMKRLKGNNPIMTSYRVPEKGTYHVLFHDKHDNSLSQDPVEWKLRYLSEMDSLEPNGKADQASELSIPDTLAPAIFPKGDRDYYKIVPEKSGKLLVKPKNVKGKVQPKMRVQKRADVKLTRVHGWKPLPKRFPVKKDSTYFLQLHDKHDNNRAPKSFELILTW
ncbi:MAG: hypothetical protein ABEH38_07030 [Flavobacteriales bacterium]